MRSYLRSKIHMATVTEAKVDYIGSITIGKELIEKAGFDKGEKVAVIEPKIVLVGKRNKFVKYL